MYKKMKFTVTYLEFLGKMSAWVFLSETKNPQDKSGGTLLRVKIKTASGKLSNMYTKAQRGRK